MPRDGSLTPADLIGKLDVLRVECEKCGRAGRYRVDRLVQQLGPDAKLTDWLADITADCSRSGATFVSPMRWFRFGRCSSWRGP